jgi:hypothetical protein
MSSIKLGLSNLNKYERAQINIIVDDPWHYEYLYSIAAFSKFYSNNQTNIFATIQISLEDIVNDFPRQLALEMINDSIEGNSQNRNNLDPIILLNKSNPTICLLMPGVNSTNFCTIDVPISVFSRVW